MFRQPTNGRHPHSWHDLREERRGIEEETGQSVNGSDTQTQTVLIRPVAKPALGSLLLLLTILLAIESVDIP